VDATTFETPPNNTDTQAGYVDKKYENKKQILKMVFFKVLPGPTVHLFSTWISFFRILQTNMVLKRVYDEN